MTRALGGALGFLMRALIRAYQFLVSPFFPACCRYAPSCSHYTLEAIEMHGPVKGVSLGARRLMRCHPWGGSGYDPVPQPLAARPPPQSAVPRRSP